MREGGTFGEKEKRHSQSTASRDQVRNILVTGRSFITITFAIVCSLSLPGLTFQKRESAQKPTKLGPMSPSLVLMKKGATLEPAASEKASGKPDCRLGGATVLFLTSSAERNDSSRTNG